MMFNISEKKILSALKKVSFSDGETLVSVDGVSSIKAKDRKVTLILNQDKIQSKNIEKVAEESKAAILNNTKAKEVNIVITGEKAKDEGCSSNNGKESPKRQEQTSEAIPESLSRPKPPTPKAIAGVKNIIAVASGKGGVGKSTISVILAQALAAEGKKVGLVDADIHGPSISRMMGLADKKEPALDENKKMLPYENHGVKCMSMGFMLPENAPVVWRGPMITKALAQMMLGCSWGELDYLIMDLPPGTGDIQLSMAQNYKINGVILVSTPQEIALMDVKKAASMFQKVDIPIIGLIENMAYLENPETGEKNNIFGDGKNIQNFCAESNIELLKQIKIDPDIARACDNGLKINGNPLKNIASKF